VTAIDTVDPQEVAAQLTIRETLVRYCRGVDRVDRKMPLSAYHLDAIDDHGSSVGRTAEGDVHHRRVRQRVTGPPAPHHQCVRRGRPSRCGPVRLVLRPGPWASVLGS
jgi:hypothetical protein